MHTQPLSARDLSFVLHEWLDVGRMCERAEFADHSIEDFDALLDLSATIATDHFAPHAAQADAVEPRLVDGRVVLPEHVETATNVLQRSGLLSAAFPESLGGLNLPRVIHRACLMWFEAANITAVSYSVMTIAAANLLAEHGAPDHVTTFVEPMLAGRYFGTMCLSEPHAGSSLIDITTRATRQPDGTYRVVGDKMWISCADHELGENIVHLVLARTDSSNDTAPSLSLFIVPKTIVDGELAGERNDVVTVGLNHKMGYRGTTNAALAFGDGTYAPGGRPGAVAHLIGAEGRGLAQMFHMMNEARIFVGAGATALGYAGYLYALEYAKNRPQGRLEGRKDPSASPVPISQHADVRRMLLAAKTYVETSLSLVLLAAQLFDDSRTATTAEERGDALALLELLTPVVKSWPSHWALRANDLAIQVLGGAGYTRDHPVERLYRDNRLNPIHEGTTGIQGIDLLGRKVGQDHGRGMHLLDERIRHAVHAGDDDLGSRLLRRWEHVQATTRTLAEIPDRRRRLANATAYLDAFGHLVAGLIQLEQHTIAARHDDSFHRGKVAAAEYFFAYELPLIDLNLTILDDIDASMLLDLDESVL